MIYFSLHSNLYYLADTFFLIETGRKRKKYNKLKQKMKKGGKWQKERRREKSAVWYCCEMSWNDCRCWENSSFKHVLHTCVGVFKLSSHLKKKKKEKRNPPVYSRLVIYTSKPVGAENIKYASDRCCGKVDPLVIITKMRKYHIVTGWSPTDVAFCVAFCLKVGYKIGLNLGEAALLNWII